MHNHPFHVLQAAIESGDERHALAVAGHDKIRAGFQLLEAWRYKSMGGLYQRHTIATCTEAAVGRAMTELLLVLDQLNHRKVSKAVWYATRENRGTGNPNTTTPAAILGIADQFTKDWRWAKVRDYFLLRLRGRQAGNTSTGIGSHPLARLPDPLFRHVVSFLKPTAFRPSSELPHPLRVIQAMQALWDDEALDGEDWHSYSPHESDYLG